MNLLNEKALIKEVKKFISSYMERGVGGYSGRELELLVLAFVLRVNPKLSGLSMFGKSKELKVTETKLKNMLYEIKLREEDNISTLVAHLEENLDSAEFQNGKLVIELDDVFCQKKVKAILKREGFITDSSFNSDLMKIPYEGFISIVTELYPDKKSQAKFKDLVATKKLASTNREVLRSFSIPGTNLKVGSLWDLAKSATTSVKSHIQSKKSEQKEKSKKAA